MIFAATVAKNYKVLFEDMSVNLSMICLKFLYATTKTTDNMFDLIGDTMNSFPGASLDILLELKKVKDEKMPGNINQTIDNVFLIQALKSGAVVDPLKIIVVMPWEGMSALLEKSEMDSQCTSRLTQGKYQESMTTCCTGENSPPPSPSPGLEMSGWLGWKGILPS